MGEWAKGTRTVQNAADEHRLRVAYEVAALLVKRDSPETAQAWFQGLNPELGDQSPARLLREGYPPKSPYRHPHPRRTVPRCGP